MFLSIVIPTLNSEKTLGECLAAIRAQTLPRSAYEIVVADAGSSDGTIAVAHEYGVDTIVANPLKTGEAGKTAGIKAAKGDCIALIDSDNIAKSEAGQKALDAIINGDDYNAAIVTMEAEWSEYCTKHLWD